MDEKTRAKLYRTAKGFGGLFWAVLLIIASMLCLEKTRLGWKALQLICLAFVLPLAEGFMALRHAEPLRCRRGMLRLAIALAIVVAYLTPLMVSWRLAPRQPFLTWNVVAYYLASIALLFVECRLVREYAAWLPDATLVAEANLVSGMVLLLAVLGVGLLWYVLRDWPDRSLVSLGIGLLSLSAEARLLLLLPFLVAGYLFLLARRTVLNRLLTAE